MKTFNIIRFDAHQTYGIHANAERDHVYGCVDAKHNHTDTQAFSRRAEPVAIASAAKCHTTDLDCSRTLHIYTIGRKALNYTEKTGENRLVYLYCRISTFISCERTRVLGAAFSPAIHAVTEINANYTMLCDIVDYSHILYRHNSMCITAVIFSIFTNGELAKVNLLSDLLGNVRTGVGGATFFKVCELFATFLMLNLISSVRAGAGGATFFLIIIKTYNVTLLLSWYTEIENDRIVACINQGESTTKRKMGMKNKGLVKNDDVFYVLRTRENKNGTLFFFLRIGDYSNNSMFIFLCKENDLNNPQFNMSLVSLKKIVQLNNLFRARNKSVIYLSNIFRRGENKDNEYFYALRLSLNKTNRFFILARSSNYFDDVLVAA